MCGGEARWEEIQVAIVWREKIGAEARERQLKIIHHIHTEPQSDIPNWSPDLNWKGHYAFQEGMPFMLM